MIYQSYDDLDKLISERQGSPYQRNLRDDKITFFESAEHQMILIQKLSINERKLLIITMKQSEKFKNLQDMEPCAEKNHRITFL